MPDIIASLLARLSLLIVPMERRPEPFAIPIRRDDWHCPRRGDRRN